MNEFEQFQREVETALPALHERAEDSSQPTLVAWGGADAEHNQILKRYIDEGHPMQAGLLTFDGEDFELKLTPGKDPKWDVPRIDIFLAIGAVGIPANDPESVADVFDCQHWATFEVSYDDDGEACVYGVSTSLPRAGLSGAGLANAIDCLRVSAGQLLDLFEDAPDDDDANDDGDDEG